MMSLDHRGIPPVSGIAFAPPRGRRSRLCTEDLWPAGSLTPTPSAWKHQTAPFGCIELSAMSMAVLSQGRSTGG